VAEERVAVCESRADAKKYLAHSYMSTKVDVSVILQEFPNVALDSWVMKAAQKAFKKTISPEPLTIQREEHAYPNADELRVGQLVSENASVGENDLLIQVYQLKNAVESLPIAVAGTTIALHFSEPNLEVVFPHNE